MKKNITDLSTENAEHIIAKVDAVLVEAQASIDSSKQFEKDLPDDLKKIVHAYGSKKFDQILSEGSIKVAKECMKILEEDSISEDKEIEQKKEIKVLSRKRRKFHI